MRLLSTFAALTLVAVLMPAGSGVDDVAGNDRMPRRITIDSISPEWTRRVEWGIDRFRDAGLPLPAMAITVHADDAACDGNSGLYLPNDPVEIHLCMTGPVDSRPARLTTLHELAHAWAESQLSTEERAAFLELRELDAWYDARIPRHERGMEHAAEVVSWGLMDEMIPIVRIYDAEPADLSIAFDLLVERPPLWSLSSTEPRWPRRDGGVPQAPDPVRGAGRRVGSTASTSTSSPNPATSLTPWSACPRQPHHRTSSRRERTLGEAHRHCSLPGDRRRGMPV